MTNISYKYEKKINIVGEYTVINKLLGKYLLNFNCFILKAKYSVSKLFSWRLNLQLLFGIFKL